MVKLLHDWLSRLTLLCLVAFAAGGVAKAVDVTFHCHVQGEGTAKMFYMDMSTWATYSFDVVDGEDIVFPDLELGGGGFYAEINTVTPKEDLTDILVNGVHSDDAWKRWTDSGHYNATFTLYPDANGVYEADLTLVFGESEPEPEYDFLINLTVEGGEADVEAQYTGAEGRQTVDLVEGPNYISGIKAGLMNRRGVTVFASDAEGYVIKEIYLNDEAQTVGRAIQLQSATVPVEYDLRVVCEEDAPAASGLVLHCTIDGEGSADVKTYSSAGGDTEAQPVVNGDVVFDDVYQGLSYLPVTIENIQGELADIIIDGDTDNEQSTAAWNEYMNSGKQYASFKVYFVDGVCEATLDLVFESEEPQPEYNQTYNIEIEGEGTVDYIYQNKDLTQGTVNGTFVEGPNYFNVFANMDGTGYKVDIYPKAAQGYELSDIQFDGYSDTYALDEVKANGFFSNVTEAKTTNIKFVFTEAGPVTQTYNVTINGEGCSATYSYTDATSGEEVSGPLTNGSSVGMNPYYSETSGYWVYITPVPAEGYDLVSATANGAEVDIAQWQYMKQHFLVKCPDATVDLVLNFEPLAAEDFTVKFEVEGEGGQLRFGPYSMDLYNFDYQPVENGSELSYAVKKLLADSQGYYVGLEMNDGEGKAVNQVLVNGVLDEEVTSGLQTLDKAYFYLPADVNPATIKVVFGEPAPDYTQIYKINIEGEGTLMGTYTDAESGDELEIEMLDGETYQLNIYKGSRGYYNLTLRPEAAGGYTLADIKVNGQTDMQAMFDVNNYGYFNSQVEAFGATTEITVVFDGGSQPEYLQTYNVTVIGNGKASYMYYPADGSGIQRGELTDGAVIGMNPPLMSNGYEIYIDVEPADGEELVSITANGEEVDLGAYWAVGINPIVAYTTGETVDLVIEFTDNASPGDEFIYGFNVEVEGEGTVDYYYANSLPKYLRGTFELGVLNKFNDVWHSSFGGYWMNIIPVPAAGWKVDAVYSGGTALEFDEENQWYEVNTETAGTVFDIKVVFVEDVKDFDVAVNLTVEGGEADVTYTYYNAVDDQEMTGTVNAGMNEYSNVAYSESLGGYVVDLNVTAAEGSMVKEIYVDGVLSQYGTDFASLVSTEKGHVFEVRVVCEQEIPEDYHKVTIKPTGNEEVLYWIAYSNVEAQKQEFYYSTADEEVVFYVPDNAFCSWNYNVPLDYTVRDLLVDGQPLDESYFNVTADMTVELDYVETGYYVITYEEPVGGDIIIEYQEYDINIYDYVYLPYEDGMVLTSGTKYRVTFEAADNYFLTGAYVDGEKVFEATPEDGEFEYTYEGTIWSDVTLKIETVADKSVDGVYAEPVQMYVYSVDGMLIRSCMAKSVDEAVDGLAQGLYIVNGEKVLVEE